MLFQGQEFASSSPFLFFADHEPELARLVHKGRREFLTQFPSLGAAEMQARVRRSRPIRDTFDAANSTFPNAKSMRMVRPAPRSAAAAPRGSGLPRAAAGGVDGAVLAAQAFVLRFFGEDRRRPVVAGQSGSRPALDAVPGAAAGARRGESGKCCGPVKIRGTAETAVAAGEGGRLASARRAAVVMTGCADIADRQAPSDSAAAAPFAVSAPARSVQGRSNGRTDSAHAVDGGRRGRPSRC